MELAAAHSTRQPYSSGRAAHFGVTKVLVLLLLCAVPILSTLAKDSIYLPKSNTVHFINIAAKMKVADAPVAISQPEIAEPMIAIQRPEPQIPSTRQDELEVPPVVKVSLTICLQHRSPPRITA
jgi:hypothetical protein